MGVKKNLQSLHSKIFHSHCFKVQFYRKLFPIFRHFVGLFEILWDLQYFRNISAILHFIPISSTVQIAILRKYCSKQFALSRVIFKKSNLKTNEKFQLSLNLCESKVSQTLHSCFHFFTLKLRQYFLQYCRNFNVKPVGLSLKIKSNIAAINYFFHHSTKIQYNVFSKILLYFLVDEF